MDYDILIAILKTFLPPDETSLRSMSLEDQDILRGALLEFLEALDQAVVKAA